MHSELQAILDLKIESAQRSLQEMGESLHPKIQDPRYAMLQSEGVLSDPWRPEHFWHALEAFIVTIRSIPDVIQSWGGDHRQKNKPWYRAISANEQKRRAIFQAKFKSLYDSFS